MKWILAASALFAFATLVVQPALINEGLPGAEPSALVRGTEDTNVDVDADLDAGDAPMVQGIERSVADEALQLDVVPPPEPADGGSISQAQVPQAPETPIEVQSDGNSEINVNPSIAMSPTDDVDALSTEAAQACASIEVAIEAVRVQDWPQFEEAIYRAVPAASSAGEIAISRLSAELLDLPIHPNPAQKLNEMITVCVSEGHQL